MLEFVRKTLDLLPHGHFSNEAKALINSQEDKSHKENNLVTTTDLYNDDI